MSERAHTKGPLAIHRQDSPCTIDGFYHVTEVGKERPAVAYVHSREDATLYAAAPDMFEALQAVELARMTDEPKHWRRATDLTDAALRKASPSGDPSHG